MVFKNECIGNFPSGYFRRMLTVLGVAVLLGGPTSNVYADWRAARVTTVQYGYDGTTVSFILEGWARSNCTCYPTWPNTMCLDRSHASFKEQMATLLLARASDRVLNVNIDESTCRVIAMTF